MCRIGFRQVWTRCPRALYRPDCSPIERPVMPNDTCMQATVWPPRRPVSAVGGESQSMEPCPPVVQGDPTLPYYHGDTGQQRKQILTSTVYATPPTQGGDKAFPSKFAGIFNRWHQAITVVYPPGTVAVLPTRGRDSSGDPSLHDHGGNESIDARISTNANYAWSLNHLHVSQVVVNSAPVSRQSNIDTSSTQCDHNAYRGVA